MNRDQREKKAKFCMIWVEKDHIFASDLADKINGWVPPERGVCFVPKNYIGDILLFRSLYPLNFFDCISLCFILGALGTELLVEMKW